MKREPLTKDEVLAIYELSWQREKPLSLIQIARIANVSKMTVWRIKVGRYRAEWTELLSNLEEK